MKIIQINTSANVGSTGRIAEDIGSVLIKNCHESYIAFGRRMQPSQSKLIRIGNKLDNYMHGMNTLLFDRHAFASRKASLKLVRHIERIQPDAIGLHNLHGYYLNIEILFRFLKESNIPVLWTLFDCWAFTGHCTYFDDISCLKWKTHCNNCPKYKNYPASLFTDNSSRNFEDKKALFTSLNNMELVVHSNWLAGLIKQSFLGHLKINVTPTAVDMQVFRPVESNLRKKYNLDNKPILLGCANIWTNRKGFEDFIELNKLLKQKFNIVMVGLNNQEMKKIPKSILGLKRTDSLQELVEWYSIADIFVNPTSQDNFPTTNLEAIACGTPVITYDTGGSPEAVDENTGCVVKKGDVAGLAKAVIELNSRNRAELQVLCRARAEKLFNKDLRYLDYIHLYEELVSRSV